MSRTAAVTGAYGFLGSRICDALEGSGWTVRRLVRNPKSTDSTAHRFALGVEAPPSALNGTQLLVHCAYDMSLVTWPDIERVNISGSRSLLQGAKSAGVAKIVTLSSMSAYDGTRQMYGRAKLAIESATAAVGGWSVRPGLVYGQNPGGMVGAILGLFRLPVVPIVGAHAKQYPVDIDDFLRALTAIVETDELPSGPIGIAQPDPVTFATLLRQLAPAGQRPPRFVPVPWRVVYGALRLGELGHLPLPFRADSLLGLIRPAPFVPGMALLQQLGVVPRPVSEVRPGAGPR